MPGIFALASASDFDRARRSAADLAEKMALYPWQKTRVLELPESGVILGAVVHDTPGWNQDGYSHQEGAISCVVDGYFIRSLSECGATDAIRAGLYAQAAISAYRKFGADFVRQLEGAFAVVIFDADRGEFIAGNGHLANPHLYWSAERGDTLYCTLLGPMVGCRFFEPRADHRAIGRILTDGSLSGTETLFEDVRALELASIVRHSLRDGERSSRIYWTFGRGLEPEFDKSFKTHLTELCDAITAAGERITSRNGRYVAGLSGGLDSRLVAAVAVKSCPEMKAWTFGAADSPDMIIAKQLASRMGIEQLIWRTRPELVPELAAEYALTVDGCISSDFAYGLERTRGLMEHADIVLNGLAGGSIMGDSLVGPSLKMLKTKVKELSPLELLSPTKLLGRKLTDEQVARFMALKTGRPSALAQYMDVPPAPILERIRQQVADLPDEVGEYHQRSHLMMTNRITRWTMMGILSDRHFYSDGSLFYDYEVLDRCMAAPQSIREGNRLYSAVFSTLVPEVAAISNANNGLRADASPLRSHLNKISRALVRLWKPVRVANPATANDPGGWSRRIYPDHYRRLLDDPRTQARPFWDGPGIAKLYEKHLAGEVDIATPLGQLASIEYFFRKWVD